MSCNAGGKRIPQDKEASQTAIREMLEETSGVGAY